MKKYIIVIIAACLLFISISVTYAFLTKLNSKPNTFELGNVVPEIKETFVTGNKIKEDVYIKNNGNIDVYVRVALVFSFEDENGNILSDEPILDEDYTIDFSSSTNWILGDDGYYYYKEKIGPSSFTDILIDSCRSIKNYDDKVFNLEIVTQAIQADPKRAVEEAWGVTITNDSLTLPEGI